VSDPTDQSPIERILVVDDEEALRNALAQFIRRRGFEVETAASGEEALARINAGKFALVLLDVRMPGMTGPEVVPEALGIDPDLAILMLTSVNDATTAAICMQHGAFDYLTKPIELTDLGDAIDRQLRRRHTILQGQSITAWLQEEVERQTDEVEQEQQKVERVTTATLEALINALEAKSDYLAGHSARVAAFSANITSEMGLPEDEIERVRLAGRLHDLGLIGVRESVLDKEGKLTAEEYDHVKRHVVIGSEILAPLTHLGPVVDYVRTHHERWDGSGYPDGLAGNDIPLGGRIICAAEVYDALTTSRPYQDRLTPEAAVDRMRTLSGSVIDPAVMEGFAGAVARRQMLVFLDGQEDLS
jgi:putative two-component system response regulator